MTSQRTTLLRLLESVYRGPAWHGPAVLVALRGLTAREASWAAEPGRPSIQQLVLHLAYSRHLMRGRLRGTPGSRFERPLAKSWWPRVAGPLAEDLALLDSQQERLIAEIRSASIKRLETVRHAAGYTLAEELLGHAIHDGYHAGQIIMIRKIRGTS